MPEKEKPSTFVTVIAWIFIVLGGFATFMTALQNIMIFFFIPRADMKKGITNPEVAEQTPAIAQFIFAYFDWFFLLAFIMSLVAFVSAIGLLKRMNWARIVFIILMGLGIAWNVGGTVFQFYFFQSMTGMEGQAPPPEFQTMQNIIMGASLVMVLAFTVLFGWIIKKLTSETVVEEFA